MKISWDSILAWKGQLVLVGTKSASALFNGRLVHMNQESLTIEGVPEGADRWQPPGDLNSDAIVPLKVGEQRQFDRDDLASIDAAFEG